MSLIGLIHFTELTAYIRGGCPPDSIGLNGVDASAPYLCRALLRFSDKSYTGDLKRRAITYTAAIQGKTGYDTRRVYVFIFERL